MSTAIHANRIAGTGFDAQAAVDATQRVDFVAQGEFLDGIFWIFTGLDVDTLGWASGGAEKTSGAVGGVVLTEGQTVTATEGVGIGGSLLGILNRNGGLKSFCQTKHMESVDAEITPETKTGN